MNSNFKLLNKTKQTVDYYEKILQNYAKEDRILKENIQKTCYDLIECLFAYNMYDTDRIKFKYLKQYVIKLGMLDYYTNSAKKKKTISEKQCMIICNFIIEARRISYTLLRGNIDDDNL